MIALAAIFVVLAVVSGGVVAALMVPGAPACVTKECPDLVVDQPTFEEDAKIEEREFAETSCSVKEGAVPAGKHKLVVFTVTTLNVGAAALEIGAPAHRPDLFQYHPCHEHYHFRDFAHYRLWEADRYDEWRSYRSLHPFATSEDLLAKKPSLRDAFVAGEKQGFCLRDDSGPGGDTPLGVPAFTECDVNQGLSVGWGDKYNSTLDGQWIVLDDVPPGEYVLEAELNPLRVIPEESFRNNFIAQTVRVT